MLTVDPNERDGPGMPSVRGFSRYGSTSVGSIRGIAMSFASTEYGGTGSFDTGVTVRDVLSRRYTAESRAEGLRKFRNDPSQHTIYNSKRLGIVLLLLSMINICLFVVLQVRRSSHAECTINIPDDSSNVNGVWDSQISKKDCIGDISRFEQADTVHVYYTINNYPFHGASVFRLHSKEQIEGKEVSKDDIKNCFPYDIVHVDGKEQIIYPCGPHIWHLYNDSFKFSTKQYSTSSLVPVALDESQELLAQRQEFAIARNPPDQEISRSYKNTYYWLQSNAKEITAHEKPKRVGEKVDSTTMLKKTVHQLRATEKLMAAHKAGVGMENGHVIQWMTPSPFKTIKKLYGALTGPISFPLFVNANIAYDTKAFGGRKTLSIVVPSWPYGRLTSTQTFLGVLILLCLPLSMILLLSKPGDPGRCTNLI